MLQEKKLNTNSGVFVGLVLLSSTQFLLSSHYISPTVSLIFGWIAIMALCWGCMNYAEGKGYSKWYGLLGILSCVGFVILAVMPDRNKNSPPKIPQ